MTYHSHRTAHVELSHALEALDRAELEYCKPTCNAVDCDPHVDAPDSLLEGIANARAIVKSQMSATLAALISADHDIPSQFR